MSLGASPESVTPMALSVLHEWGTGLTITGSCIRNSAAALESTALSPHTTTSTTALSPRKTHDQQYGVEPRTTSTVLSPRKSTASAVKQWLRADDANEPLMSGEFLCNAVPPVRETSADRDTCICCQSRDTRMTPGSHTPNTSGLPRSGLRAARVRARGPGPTWLGRGRGRIPPASRRTSRCQRGAHATCAATGGVT